MNEESWTRKVLAAGFVGCVVGGRWWWEQAPAIEETREDKGIQRSFNDDCLGGDLNAAKVQSNLGCRVSVDVTQKIPVASHTIAH